MKAFQISFTCNGGIEEAITVQCFCEEEAVQEAFLALYQEDFIKGVSNFYELKSAVETEVGSIYFDFDQIFLEWALALFFEVGN